MTMRKARFIEFGGSAEELSRELFGVTPHVLLGGTPLSVAVPPEHAVVDVSLPTAWGANISRFSPRAVIEHLARRLDDPGTKLFAVWTDGADIGFEDEGLALELEACLPRLRAENDNAATIASYLVCHPEVAEVFYPGLKTDDGFALAAQILAHGFGNVVEYSTEDDGTIRRIHATAGDIFDQIEELERAL